MLLPFLDTQPELPHREIVFRAVALAFVSKRAFNLVIGPIVLVLFEREAAYRAHKLKLAALNLKVRIGLEQLFVDGGNELHEHSLLNLEPALDNLRDIVQFKALGEQTRLAIPDASRKVNAFVRVEWMVAM